MSWCGAPAGHLTSTRRSEEHTSELQSQSNIVCRLLLEKKKIDYVILKIRGDEAVVGSIGTYGEGQEAAHFYNYGGLAYSFTGASGRFHLISSITGEKL